MGGHAIAALFDYGLPALALGCLLALFIQRAYHSRSERKRSEQDFLRFSTLNLVTSTLAESSDPRQMVEQTLDRLLQGVEATDGTIIVQSPGTEGLHCASARGLSAASMERIFNGPLRDYLAGSSQRWGGLMVFPDIRQAQLASAWQRDPQFREFREAFISEGLVTLVVVGVEIKGKPCGAAVVASRRPRNFRPGELRMLLAVGNQMSVGLENLLLRKDADRHNEQLHLLHRIGDALNTTFDPDGQLRILRRELAGFLGPTNFYLVFQDSAVGRLETVFALEAGQATPKNGVTGLAEHVLRTRQALRLSRNLVAEAARAGITSVNPAFKTWCGIPLEFSDGSLGVLALADSEREDAIDDHQFEFLQVLANGIAAAIENARMFQREQRRARHLALLNEIGRKATSVLDPSELLVSIPPHVRAAFGYDLVHLDMMNREKGDLVVASQDGYDDSVIGRRFKLGEGFAGLAAEKGEPILANRVETDSRYIPLADGIRSALALPLKFGDEPLGVLSLASRQEQAFSHQEVLALRTLTDQVAIALHNARMYQVAQDQAITDGLTGLKTHRYFMEALEAEWRRATRSGRHFSVIMMDLDNFKPVNDRYGHLEGDKVLACVGRLLDGRSRQSNVMARYGGDEFVVLMPEGSTEQAQVLAERLRSSLGAEPQLASHGLTASFGIASFPTHAATPEEVLRFADAGMYLAKHERGDRVRVALHPGSSNGDWERQLLEAYLGVAVKRMFSTGPEAFNEYLKRFQQAGQAPQQEGPSLLDTVTALAFAIDAKDHYTQGHSQSVSRLAAQIGREIGLTDAELEEIRLAGILHDVGKIGVPESVLNKVTRLTDEEFEIMKGHAVMGWKILEPLRVQAIERIRKMVRHHHERFDGRGYPDGIGGDDIPLGARILTIADSYDTMVSDRAYKKGRPVNEALEELLRCRGGHFDAELVDAFLRSLEAEKDPEKRSQFEKAAN